MGLVSSGWTSFWPRLLALTIATAALPAAGVGPSDPSLRSQLLDAVRPKGARLIVKHISTDGESAYICAIAAQERGGVLRELEPGKGLEVREWVLVKEATTARWLKIEWSSYEIPAGPLHCYNEKRLANLDVALDELRLMVSNILKQDATDVSVNIPEYVSSDPPAEEIFKELSRRRLADPDIEVDGEDARDWSPSEMERAAERCKTNACRTNLRASILTLKKMASSSTISAIVWNGCTALLRASPEMPVATCMDLASGDEACVRGLMYFRDRDRIQACKFAIRRSCERATAKAAGTAVPCRTESELRQRR